MRPPAILRYDGIAGQSVWPHCRGTFMTRPNEGAEQKNEQPIYEEMAVRMKSIKNKAKMTSKDTGRLFRRQSVGLRSFERWWD